MLTAIKITHRVNVHFRSLSLTNVPFDNILRNAEKVYAQYGIKIHFTSGMSLFLTPAQLKKFAQVDGQCAWKITSGEYAEIQRLEAPKSSSEICVYFVSKFSNGTTLGCGGHAPGRPACICAAAGSQWTMAHEVGHVLLGSAFHPVHSSDAKNLMYASTPGITATLPSLTPQQVEQIKKSPYCRKI